MMAESR
jgi:DNA repair protein RAD51